MHTLSLSLNSNPGTCSLYKPFWCANFVQLSANPCILNVIATSSWSYTEFLLFSYMLCHKLLFYHHPRCECCRCHFHYFCIIFSDISIQQSVGSQRTSSQVRPAATVQLVLVQNVELSTDCRLKSLIHSDWSRLSKSLRSSWSICIEEGQTSARRRSTRFWIYLDVCLNILSVHPLNPPAPLPTYHQCPFTVISLHLYDIYSPLAIANIPRKPLTAHPCNSLW